MPKATVPAAMVARIGAVNTVRFGPEGPRGHDTEQAGFIAAYRAAYGNAVPCLPPATRGAGSQQPPQAGYAGAIDR